MISIEKINEWKKALEGLSYSFYHTWEYCSAMFESSNLPTFLYVGILNDKKILCPFSIRQKENEYPEIVTPYGFSGFIHNFSKEMLINFFKKEWIKFALNNNFVTAFIMQHPCFLIDKSIFSPYLQDYNKLFLINLSKSLEEIWKKMRKGHKYALKKLIKEKPNLKVFEKINEKIIDELAELYIYTLDRVKASKIYYFNKLTLKKLINYTDSLLIGIVENNQLKAASLFLYTPWVVEYFLNASNEKYKKYSRLLLWEAIKIFKKLNISILNLGGGVKPMDSLEEFKKGFGGIEITSQVIKQVFCYKKYKYLFSKYIKSYSSYTDFFPAYWKNEH